jgi:Putative Flp pilus-assembly TadE/G-like
MRALTRRDPRDDRAAVLVWVGVSLVALLGMGAMVVDVGALYAERRELQNGADAAALAVAKDCAEGDCDGTGEYGPDEYATAGEFADQNANDGESDVPLVCGDDGDAVGLAACPEPPDDVPEEASGWVLVDTSTRTEDDGTQIEYVLAPVLDAANVGKTVEARAIAAWGPANPPSTIPLIFSICEFNELGGSLDDGASFPLGEQIIGFHGVDADDPDVIGCNGSPSGLNLPGGFGWLADDGACRSEIDQDRWIDNGTGNSVPQGCDLTEWQNAEVLLPIYDDLQRTGNNGEYHVIGFVGFKITGYNFNGNSNDWPKPPEAPRVDCPGNGGDETCLRGEFTRIVTSDGGIGGGGEDFGARAVRMIG